MFGYLLLLFTVLPALELIVIIEVGERIGSVNTLFLIILTGVAGASLARFQGFLVLNKIQDNLNRGILPSAELLDGLMILVGGVVLLTPGFITDTLGILLLIPWSRSIIKFWTRKKFESMVRKEETIHVSTFKRREKPGPYDDIDVN